MLPPPDLTGPIIDSLETLISGTTAFQFSLTQAKQFEHGVVYLQPEPAEPFAQLTKEISRRFGMLPYGGEFGQEPLAHLTVAIVEPTSTRQHLLNLLSALSPIVVRAEEAWLMVGSNTNRWNIVRQMRFRD